MEAVSPVKWLRHFDEVPQLGKTQGKRKREEQEVEHRENGRAASSARKQDEEGEKWSFHNDDGTKRAQTVLSLVCVLEG